MSSATDNLVDQQVVEVPEVVLPNQRTSKYGFLEECIRQMVNSMELLRLFWINYYLPTFGEEAVILPPPLHFIITGLYALAQIKSQGADFPFQSHPLSIKVSLASLLAYGLSSAAEHLVSVLGLDPVSVYAIIARLGRIGCLLILLLSLAYMIY